MTASNRKYLKKPVAATGFLLWLLLLAGTLSACSESMTDIPKPLGYKRLFLRNVPEGNDSFSIGWRDGCDTMLGAVGIGKLRTIGPKLDSAKFTEDALYQKGYNTGSTYCANFLDYN